MLESNLLVGSNSNVFANNTLNFGDGALSEKDIKANKGGSLPAFSFYRPGGNLGFTGWTATRASLTLNSTTDADGNNNGAFLKEDNTASNTHYLEISKSSQDLSTAFVFGIFAKANGRTAFRVQLFWEGSTNTNGKALTLGTLTGMPGGTSNTGFRVGETVTGSISGATGTVVAWDDVWTVSTVIQVFPITGTFQVSDVVTGGTSGAGGTITSIAAMADQGAYIDFNLSSVATANSTALGSGLVVTSGISDAGNSWRKCWIGAVINMGASAVQNFNGSTGYPTGTIKIRILLENPINTTSYNGDNTSGIYLYNEKYLAGTQQPYGWDFSNNGTSFFGMYTATDYYSITQTQNLVYQKSQTYSRSQFRTALASLSSGGIPSGAIILWNGNLASPPANFHVCDGTSSTPDLRDRFIIGGGTTYTVGNTGGTIGSQTTVNSGGHTHTMSTDSFGHQHTTGALGVPVASSGAIITSGGEHAHGTQDGSVVNKKLVLTSVVGKFKFIGYGDDNTATETVTGSVSGASATTYYWDPIVTTLVVTGITGTFQVGDTVTGGTSGAHGVVASIGSFGVAGNYGGNRNYTLTTNDIFSHNHTVNGLVKVPLQTDNLAAGTSYAYSARNIQYTGGSGAHGASIYLDGNHTHTATINTATHSHGGNSSANTGHTHTVDRTPPYYGLGYIRRD